jgi:GPH family glycoside/pentoside/hexuronide:cation symporter
MEKRIGIITPHTGWISTFSCTGGNKLVPEIAHLKIKTMVGARIS